MDPKDIVDLWGSGFVNRWHTHPHTGLRNSQDLTSAHSHRMLILLLAITEQDPAYNAMELAADMMAIIFHDSPEVATGDLGYPFKQANPKIKKILGDYDRKWFNERGVPHYEMTPICHLMDRLDSYLYMLTHASDLRYRAKWEELRMTILADADDLGYFDTVNKIIIKQTERDWF